MKKNKIKEIITIQQYFNCMVWIVEKLFESQKTKLEGVGYDFYSYNIKTEYRLKKVFISLKKIIETLSYQELIDQVKVEREKFGRKAKKGLTSNYANPKFDINSIMKTHCKTILWLLEKDALTIEFLHQYFRTDLCEGMYDYIVVLNSILLKKKHNFGFFYKEKAITQRLKKKKFLQKKYKI